MARSLGLARVPTLDPKGEQEYPSYEYIRALVRALNSNFEILNSAFGGTQGSIDDTLGQMFAENVGASQTTLNTTYVNLATVGPSVTARTREKAVVLVSMLVDVTGANLAYSAIEVSGDTTIAAADGNGAFKFNAGFETLTFFVIFDALTPGDNTFTLKYRVGGGTGTYADRSIFVIPFQ